MEEMEPSNGKIHTDGHREHAEVDQVVVKEVEEPESDTLVDDDDKEIILANIQDEEEEDVQVCEEKEDIVSEVTASSLVEEELSETVTDAERVENVLGPPPSYEEAVTVPSSSRDVEALPDAEGEDKSATLVEEYYGDRLAKESDSVNVVGSSDSVPDQSKAVTSPIISLSQRTVQPTSWRSCCGLFDVLRPSNR